MSRYAMLDHERLRPRPPTAAAAPFGFRELMMSEWLVRDEAMRRAQVQRTIREATDDLLVSKGYGEVIRMVAGAHTTPETSRPRLRWRRATPFPGEAPAYVLTVVVYPKGALP